jgi:predicted MPP superfamily phosphohydrolase
MKLSGFYVLAGLMAASGLGYVTQVEPAWLEVVRLRVRLRRLPTAFSGFRVVQISDIHLGGWMNRQRLDEVVQAVLAEAPDVVAITGDFLIGHGWDEYRQSALEELTEGLAPLVDFCPTLAVMGNHDYWTDAEKVRRMLRTTEIIELSNSVFSFRRGNAQFYIGGMDDVYEKRDRLDEVLAQLPADGAAMLMCHEPDFADQSAATGRFGLQISGHTHGGQVVFPFIGPIHTPKHGHKYPLGMYQVGDMIQYTNRGVGMARLPVRLNCRPEITVFTLEPEML